MKHDWEKEGSVWINRKYDPLITKLPSHPYPRSRDLPPPLPPPPVRYRDLFSDPDWNLAALSLRVHEKLKLTRERSPRAINRYYYFCFHLMKNRRGTPVFSFCSCSNAKRGRRPFKRVQTHAHVGGWRLIYYHVQEENCE